MNTLITLFFLTVLTLSTASVFVERDDRRWILTTMLMAWFVLFPVLVLVNHSFPFTGGDDYDYYLIASTRISSVMNFGNLRIFSDSMEQPGYPLMISVISQFTGQDILALKLPNLALFIMLIPVWYRIGIELDSEAFGRVMGVAVVLMTPLWYYGMFLLKDMTIALLESIFLLGVVQILRDRVKNKGWLLILSATLAVIPFRTYIVLLNIAVLAGSGASKLIRIGKKRTIIATLIVSAMMIVGVLIIASDTERMSAMGIYSEHRVIGTEASMKRIASSGEESMMNRALFPLLYLFSEVSGLNPNTWVNFDAISLRGLLAIPWIFFGVPFFLIGLRFLLLRPPNALPSGDIINRLRSVRLISTPWGGVVMFILAYIAASWTVGDSTRWRISDMPAMAAVAVAGWMSVVPKMRVGILMLWILSSVVLFSLFYLIRGF